MPVTYSNDSAGPSTRLWYATNGEWKPNVSYNDYANLTKAELAAELESRGLAKSGSKGDLIARLEEDDG